MPSFAEGLLDHDHYPAWLRHNISSILSSMHQQYSAQRGWVKNYQIDILSSNEGFFFVLFWNF
jgi:hypothetical protein